MRQAGKDWQTISELALRIGMSRKTVWRWVRDGKLKSERCGAQHRICEQEWQRYLGACNT
jgi:excisionase family DNA binding protein